MKQVSSILKSIRLLAFQTLKMHRRLLVLQQEQNIRGYNNVNQVFSAVNNAWMETEVCQKKKAVNPKLFDHKTGLWRPESTFYYAQRGQLVLHKRARR